jgi:hypothetical protein
VEKSEPERRKVAELQVGDFVALGPELELAVIAKGEVVTAALKEDEGGDQHAGRVESGEGGVTVIEIASRRYPFPDELLGDPVTHAWVRTPFRLREGD